MKALSFELDRKEQPVVLTGKKQGRKNCVLREMDGAQRDKYLSDMKGHMEMVDGKMVVTNYNGLHAMLLCLCLYENDKVLDEEFIQSLPTSTQNGLFLAAQEINGLTEASEAEVKKV